MFEVLNYRRCKAIIVFSLHFRINMKTNRFYLYGGLATFLFFVVFTLISLPIVIKFQALPLIESELSSLKRNVDQVANLAGIHGTQDSSNAELKAIIQMWTENSHNDMYFISAIDWSGKIISAPEPKKINTTMDGTESATSVKNLVSAQTIYSKTIKVSETGSEIAYMAPVPQSDWIIVGHFNNLKLNGLIRTWKGHFYVFSTILGLCVLLIFLFNVRRISIFYEKQLSDKLFNLKDEVLSLSKLNASLNQYQENLKSLSSSEKEYTDSKDTSKKRLLTYVRNELLPIGTNDIAYIYLDHTIVYVVRKDGKRSTSSESLDLIYSNLDEKSFFRVNRQVIVAISAIKTITKFGSSKLNIEVNPPAEVDIVIGKNKAAAFKQWLDS